MLVLLNVASLVQTMYSDSTDKNIHLTPTMSSRRFIHHCFREIGAICYRSVSHELFFVKCSV
jgi:hypothetical protein